MHTGVPVRIGSKSYTLPKLTCKLVRERWPVLTALRKKLAADKEGLATEELLFELQRAKLEMVVCALQRNHTEVTLEELENELSPGEGNHLFDQLMVLTNMNKAAEDQAGPEAVSPQS